MIRTYNNELFELNFYCMQINQRLIRWEIFAINEELARSSSEVKIPRCAAKLTAAWCAKVSAHIRLEKLVIIHFFTHAAISRFCNFSLPSRYDVFALTKPIVGPMI